MDPAPFTPEQLRTCIEVLAALERDQNLLFSRLTEEERIALTRAAGAISRPDREEHKKRVRAWRKERRQRSLAEDRAIREATGIRKLREAPVFAAPRLIPMTPPLTPETEPERELEHPRSCYVCKQEYRKVHSFYDAMCRACGDFNYKKRFELASLDGRVALVTGARVKIGYQTALRCLRAGARVIATTRFPHDAAARYAREEDYPAWRHRLHVYGLDLRHVPSVEAFAEHVNRSYDRLDFLINNACQTVRRPPAFYAHLLETELQHVRDLPPEQRLPLEHYDALRQSVRNLALPLGESETALAPAARTGHHLGLLEPARLSQLRAAFDGEDGFAVFPEGKLDPDLQQVDLRTKNSWRLTLAEVPTWELLEVQLVNAVSPFVLTARLKPLMLRDRTFDKHVVQVSAMEGIFSRGTKTDRHPHTNMAKAALNMLVVTSAPDYAKDGIYMNAVDTGWITDEDPAQHAARKKEELGFQPPLDVVDGAARVCDPFTVGLLTGQHAWGKFFKDYKPAAW